MAKKHKMSQQISANMKNRGNSAVFVRASQTEKERQCDTTNCQLKPYICIQDERLPWIKTRQGYWLTRENPPTHCNQFKSFHKTFQPKKMFDEARTSGVTLMMMLNTPLYSGSQSKFC